MSRVITVKGVGTTKEKVDLVIIFLEIKTKSKEYEETVRLMTKSIEKLQDSIKSVGFEKKYLKTVNFEVDTDYKNYRDKFNNYKSNFLGYVCKNNLKLEFDFDNKTLSKVLNVITKTDINPEFSVNFSVKNKEKIKEKLLVNAIKNARKNAEILAKASNVALGDILNIDYNWSEIYFNSHTSFQSKFLGDEVEEKSIDFEPEDINLKDTVTVVWEIK